MSFLSEWNTRRKANNARAVSTALFGDQVTVKVTFLDGSRQDVVINPGGEVVIDLRSLVAAGVVDAQPTYPAGK